VPVAPQTTDVSTVSGGAGGGGASAGGGGGGAGADATTPDGAEVATVEPFLFVAMTVTRNVFPTSVADSTNVTPLAPEIGEHAPPPASQRAQ